MLQKTTNIQIKDCWSAFNDIYLHSGPHCIHWQIEDETGNFGHGGNEKRENKLGRLVIFVLLEESGNFLHAPFVHAHIYKCRDESGRKS